ncbi:MAG: NifB/NifX family molybdenum-iron cluster-binding protein [Candidatus Izemoplasmatales bacterium]|nr:NifB/NifX family molybdenum-iron cluster-binding protein [Candidatus Izemoplasmatales bacterium]MDD4068914.1 NifB/NifX family molybdenum-iron cluster-binding protein [Candidatus Izemoplasmatales bacterium]MDY0139133.1 NifB/NifX family molybdenum-iron cluster-binding protein [Candidatus Izemoplasmatales bacterium]
MRLAIAIKDNEIAQHFGHCDYFHVHNIENKQVKSTETVKNPPHQKGMLPKFLKEHNVDVLITGNLGSLAVSNLEALGIQAIRGVNGEPKEILKCYIDGTLESSDAICDEHMNHH